MLGRYAKVIKKMGNEKYVRSPFRSRAEYVELVMLPAHYSEYADQMRRVNKQAGVRKILKRAILPTNIEYLFNGSRYILSKGGGNTERRPVGTASNEAMAIEPHSGERDSDIGALFRTGYLFIRKLTLYLL